MACTRFRLQGRKLHNEDGESCLSCTRHAYWSSSTFLPNIIKICLRYQSYGAHKDAATDGRHADRYFPEPIGREIQRVREKSRECHNHKPQPISDTKRKGEQTKPNKRKSSKRTKSTKTSSLFKPHGL